MSERTVRIALNQQQLELIDRTIEKGMASDRVTLVKHALRAYAIRHLVDQSVAERAPVE